MFACVFACRSDKNITREKNIALRAVPPALVVADASLHSYLTGNDVVSI